MDREEFSDHLRTVLMSLYDPSVLRSSPLLDLLNPDTQSGSTLQRTVSDAIESLRPDAGTPAGVRTWRIYQILRRRYIEQLSQRELATDLNLSVRQVQREEKLARDVLAEHLWTVHNVEERIRSDLTVKPAQAVAKVQAPSRNQELAEFHDSVPAQATDIDAIIRDVLKTAAPLFRLTDVVVRYAETPSLPQVWLQAPLLRQALLNLLDWAVRHAPGQAMEMAVGHASHEVQIRLAPAGMEPVLTTGAPEEIQGLRMTSRLIALCGGKLTVHAAVQGGSVFMAKIALPALEASSVLVIDDNADTRLLFQRYLAGSRFSFVGAADTQEGLARTLAINPTIIVLDAMMPGADGWTLLGQLREHPKSAHIPVIVCTILEHRELAYALGAADFLRKPVNRAAFLAALNRLVDPPAKESG